MRTVGLAGDKLAQNCGTEPILIVEIQWAAGGGVCTYADRKIADIVLGQLVEIGNIDSSVTADGSTDSSQVHLVLDDTDGAIKAIFNEHDLHKRPVWIYQWFDGLALSDKFLLFKGEINSPFVWNEGDRTIGFDVTTRIEDVEVGFSMEEGDFPVVPPDALGKAWPLVFGTVCDVKAVQVRALRHGILQSGEGIRDYTLESRICQVGYLQCADQATGTSTASNTTTQVCWGSDISAPWTGSRECVNVFPVMPSSVNPYAPPLPVSNETSGPDQTCVEDAYYEACSLKDQLAQQKAYEHATMTVIGGADLFPQHETITLNIDGGKFIGQFDGDVFTIASRIHPDYEVNPPTPCVFIADRSFGVRFLIGGDTWQQTRAGNSWYNGQSPWKSAYCTDYGAGWVPAALDGPAEARAAYDKMATSTFFWARAGSEVYLEAECEVLFIVNLLPCTITRVAAMKQTNFGPKLMTVPAEFYTIYETDYDGYTVTEIGMAKPLSQQSKVIANPDGTHRVESSKWSDDLYVTVISSVGPNPVDIITWLINKYTSLSINSASFDHVRTHLTKYPANFALLERMNVMQLISDIAVQSRCTFSVRNDVVYLRYASEEPGSVATIAVGDVLANTFQVSLSSTDDVATKHVITWSRSKAEDDLKIVLKHNVAKYGTREKSHDYYTLNIFNNVLKSATFWAIRDANAWKIVEFSTGLKHLALEVFDCVTLNLPGVALVPVKAVITAAKYDVGNQQIDFTCWTPIRAGEMAPYIHAWPALIAAGTIFPTAEERAAGLGYNFIVTPPEGHLLYSVPVGDGQPKLVLTSGDSHPSDLDDVLETCFCPITDDAYVDEPDPVFVALKKAQKVDQSNQAAQTQGGGGGGGGRKGQRPQPDDKDTRPTSPNDPDAPKPFPKVPPDTRCIFKVEVVYYIPAVVCGDCICWGEYLLATAGMVVGSTPMTVILLFGTEVSAKQYVQEMNLEIQTHRGTCPDGSDHLWGSVGVAIPVLVYGPVNLTAGDPACDPTANPEALNGLIYNPYFEDVPNANPPRGPESVSEGESEAEE